MKIVIAASHRFHLLDLAKELANLGHEVKFFSYVPKKRILEFGLKKENVCSLFFIMLPFLFLRKISKEAYWAIKICNVVLDNLVGCFMGPCDVYIALGTVYKKSFILAKKKYNAVTIMEWGSVHIEQQQEILSKIDGVRRQPKYFTVRTKIGYELVDYISVPSIYVENSFLDKNIKKEKIIKNPYGVDLKMFSPTDIDSDKCYDLIAVGAWSYQKGSDILSKVCLENKYNLLHVGSIVDVVFPDAPNMVHVDSVNQRELIKFYSKARVMVLPSRQDGFGMVLSQAVACGLPIVCSKNTGGSDIKYYLDDNKWVNVMKNYTTDSLVECIECALKLANLQHGTRNYAGPAIEKLTWAAYGQRYHFILNEIVLKNDN
jgi:alpha-maltose-1-phosphate synthase